MDEENKVKMVKVEAVVVQREYFRVEMTVPDNWDYLQIEEAALNQVWDGEVYPVDFETEVIDIDEEERDE